MGGYSVFRKYLSRIKRQKTARIKFCREFCKRKLKDFYKTSCFLNVILRHTHKSFSKISGRRRFSLTANIGTFTAAQKRPAGQNPPETKKRARRKKEQANGRFH